MIPGRAVMANRGRLPLPLACLVLAGGCATTCPAGRTMLRETCVDQAVANYVMCIRERSALLDERSTNEVNNQLEVMQFSSATAVRDNMIRHFESNDNSEVVTRIVNQCFAISKGGRPSDAPDAGPGTGATVAPAKPETSQPQPISVAPPRLSNVSVSLAVHNPGSADAVLSGAVLYLHCDGKRETGGLPLQVAAGTSAVCGAGGVTELSLYPYYRDFLVPLPHGSGCAYEVELQLTGGDLARQLLSARAERQGQNLTRRTVTVYEFDEVSGVDDPQRRRAFSDYRSAIREATLSAPNTLPPEVGAEIELELVEVGRGTGGAPRLLRDLHEIQRLTRSLEVISGTVVPSGSGTTVKGYVYIGNTPAGDQGPSPEGLFEVNLALADRVDGFEMARQCHELLIYYALYREACARRDPQHVQISYLSEADAAGAALLTKPRLPAPLVDLITRWRARIGEQLDRLRPAVADPT